MQDYVFGNGITRRGDFPGSNVYIAPECWPSPDAKTLAGYLNFRSSEFLAVQSRSRVHRCLLGIFVLFRFLLSRYTRSRGQAVFIDVCRD